ncbi:methyltransferase-like protein isoform X2 [Zingiber officinale]|uniref:methyltransferase-like protein isoform X2 n=1 Tax=Zingiber officinale TaxID=94328 RepID=UPI001C4C8E00|nr:methyltransferase-like protein isoform X2 [Zingiber officinale]
MAEKAEAEYYSKDFEWEDLRRVVENDPSLRYHLTPFVSSSSCAAPAVEADAWRSFHRRHSAGKFFKERRYLLKEFPELIRISDPVKVLEVGCGNGSTVLPILREEILRKAEEIIATGSAISLVPRFFTFLLDVSVNDFPDWLFCTSCRRNSSPEPANFSSDSRGENLEMSHMSAFLREDQCCIGGVDFVTMIFTLSAIPFKRMPSVIEKCLSVLRPGGLLLFRDYGLYDMTMLRFLSEQRVGFCEYMRSDGTFSYFFSLDTARNLFLAAGFTEVELTYCCITSVNRQTGKSMQRVWVHGKFQKPV